MPGGTCSPMAWLVLYSYNQVRWHLALAYLSYFQLHLPEKVGRTGLRYLHFIWKRKLLLEKATQLDKRSRVGKRSGFHVLEQLSFHMFNNLAKFQVQGLAPHSEMGHADWLRGEQVNKEVNRNGVWKACWSFWASGNFRLEKRVGKKGYQKNC